MASRWPPLLSLADAERGSATRQVRSGASTAFLGVELSLSVDLCHPPQAPRRQPCPPPTPPCLRAGRSGRAGREAADTAVRGERCPRPFESHLGEALAKHLRVPKASPAKSATFKRNQQIPPRLELAARAGGRTTAARRGASEHVRSRKTLPASRRVQGHRSKPSSQGALRAAGGRGGLSIGPRGQCPSFLFSSRGEMVCRRPGSPPRPRQAPPWPPFCFLKARLGRLLSTTPDFPLE